MSGIANISLGFDTQQNNSLFGVNNFQKTDSGNNSSLIKGSFSSAVPSWQSKEDSVSISSEATEAYNNSRIQLTTSMADFSVAGHLENTSSSSSKNDKSLLDELAELNEGKKTLNEIGDYTSKAVKEFAAGGSVEIFTLNGSGGANSAIAEIKNADGTSSFIKIDENTIFSQDSNGNIITTTSDSSEILGTDSDDFIVNINAKNIHVGNGNDTILSFANSGNLTLGSGNNTVIGGTSSAFLNIQAGNGNNVISDLNISGSFGNGNNTITGASMTDVTFGDGNNTIDVDFMKNTIFGDGNNKITSKSAYEITLGDGANTLTAQTLTKAIFGEGNNNISAQQINEIELGNGNNSISAFAPEESKDMPHLPFGINGLKVGDGDNSIQGTSIQDAELGEGNNSVSVQYLKGDLEAKDGKNNIFVENIFHKDADITLGGGNNTLAVNTGEITAGQISLGNGNNKVSFEALQGRVNFGDGNNEVHLDEGKNTQLNFGNGKNNINAYEANELSVRAGVGETTLDSHGSADNLYYKSEGIDKISVNGSLTNSNIKLDGRGESNIEVKDFIYDSSIRMESNNNLLQANGVFNSSLTMEDKNNAISASAIYNTNLKGENVSMNEELIFHGTLNSKNASNIREEKQAEEINSLYTNFMQSYTKETMARINKDYEPYRIK